MSEPLGPYDDKPGEVGAPGDWYEITFQMSVDTPVDWGKIDLRTWASGVCRYTALKMAASGLTEEQIYARSEPIQSMLLNLKVDKIEFLNDDMLHDLIDGEERDD